MSGLEPGKAVKKYADRHLGDWGLSEFGQFVGRQICSPLGIRRMQVTRAGSVTPEGRQFQALALQRVCDMKVGVWAFSFFVLPVLAL